LSYLKRYIVKENCRHNIFSLLNALELFFVQGGYNYFIVSSFKKIKTYFLIKLVTYFSKIFVIFANIYMKFKSK